MTYEALKQKCVDGELSNEQRHQLLDWLEQNPSEWRELACQFMEDQLFGQAVAVDSIASRPASVTKTPERPATTNQRWRHWFAHPVTSVALCLSVAFLSGMLLRNNPSPSGAMTGDSLPYQLTSAGSAEFPRAMSAALDGLGYNQPEPSKRRGPTSSTYVDPVSGRRYLQLISTRGTGIMIPLDEIRVFLP